MVSDKPDPISSAPSRRNPARFLFPRMGIGDPISLFRPIAFRGFELSADRIAEVKMHLWPSMKIRDSFTFANMQNYERNLQRMKSEKRSAAIKQKLLQSEGGDADREAAEGEASHFLRPSAIGLWVRDLLVVLSCFYCCYTWEDRVDQEC